MSQVINGCLLVLFISLVTSSICVAQSNDDTQPHPENVTSTIETPMTSAAPKNFDELPSPTESLEQYEKEKSRLIDKRNFPDLSVNLMVAPLAFRSTDLRLPSLGTPPDNPKLFGLLLSAEYMFLKEFGIISFGLEAGVYGTSHYDQFSGLATAFVAGGPYLQYQAAYFRRQWLVPMAKAEYEVIHYSYHFAQTPITGTRGIIRIDVGLMLFLNFLEPSAAADMYSDYDIKRIYLVSTYSMAQDSSKTDIDLTDNSFRFGIRFEF